MLKLFAFTQSWAMDAADAIESLKKREEGQTMAITSVANILPGG